MFHRNSIATITSHFNLHTLLNIIRVYTLFILLRFSFILFAERCVIFFHPFCCYFHYPIRLRLYVFYRANVLFNVKSFLFFFITLTKEKRKTVSFFCLKHAQGSMLLAQKSKSKLCTYLNIREPFFRTWIRHGYGFFSSSFVSRSWLIYVLSGNRQKRDTSCNANKLVVRLVRESRVQLTNSESILQ